MKKRKEKIILLFLGILFIGINYSLVDSFLIKTFNPLEKIEILNFIDGDTVKINSSSVRLLGINTPEKGELYFSEAKEYLESLVINKTTYIEYGKEKYDKYNRILGYIIVNNRNINIRLVEEGFANYYFPAGKDKYYSDFVEAWEKCIKSNKNLCEKSKNICVGCIALEKLNYNQKKIILKNTCSFECNMEEWILKGEGRKFLKLNGTINSLETKEVIFNEFWVKTGNTLFLRDDEFKLILWSDY